MFIKNDECFEFLFFSRKENKTQSNKMSDRETFTCLLEYSICYNFNAKNDNGAKQRAGERAENRFVLNGRPCHITMAYSDFQRSQYVYVCVCSKYVFDFCLYHVYIKYQMNRYCTVYIWHIKFLKIAFNLRVTNVYLSFFFFYICMYLLCVCVRLYIAMNICNLGIKSHRFYGWAQNQGTMEMEWNFRAKWIAMVEDIPHCKIQIQIFYRASTLVWAQCGERSEWYEIQHSACGFMKTNERLFGMLNVSILDGMNIP